MAKLITSADAAKRIGVTQKRVQALCQQRRIPGARLIGRSWMLPADFKVTPGTRGPQPRSGKMKRAKQRPKAVTPNDKRLETITPGDVRRVLADTAVGVANGEISAKQAALTVRDCARITRELNRRVALAARMVRLARGPKARGKR